MIKVQDFCCIKVVVLQVAGDIDCAEGAASPFINQFVATLDDMPKKQCAAHVHSYPKGNVRSLNFDPGESKPHRFSSLLYYIICPLLSLPGFLASRVHFLLSLITWLLGTPIRLGMRSVGLTRFCWLPIHKSWPRSFFFYCSVYHR